MDLNLTQIKTLKDRLIHRFHPAAVIGLDLGTSGVKIVRLERSPQGTTHRFHHYYPERVNDLDALSVNQLRKFLKGSGCSSFSAACSLTESELVIRRLDLPKMPEFDLKEAVAWELRQQGSSNEPMTVRYTLLDEYQSSDGSRLSLIAFAIRKEAVLRANRFLKNLGLRPLLLEPPGISLLAAFDRVVTWDKGVVFGFVDLGEAQSGFYAFSDGKLLFARPLTEISLQSLERLFAQELLISEGEAHRLKVQLFHPSTEPAPDDRLATLLPLFFSKIAIEIQRSLDAFSLVYSRGRVEKIYLSGGGSGLAGLSDYLEKNVGLPFQFFDPFEGLAVGGQDHCLYSVATGLALYGL